MPYDPVITDLDGTLVDSVAGVAASVRAACAAVGVELPQERDLTFVVGPPLEESLRSLLHDPGLVPAAVEVYRAHHEATASSWTTPMPGAVNALRRMHEAGIRVGVATYKPTSIAGSVLEAAGLRPWIDVVAGVGAEPSHLRKVDLIGEVLDRLGGDRATCLYVGDHAEDVLGAQEAGVAFVRFGEMDWPAIAELAIGPRVRETG